MEKKVRKFETVLSQDNIYNLIFSSVLIKHYRLIDYYSFQFTLIGIKKFSLQIFALCDYTKNFVELREYRNYFIKDVDYIRAK